ncbi:MAG: hypothetical protein IJJ34_08540 [Clostridia bacterium]|nr:hypothetical protein [Clostridia bacterium]
MKVKTVRVLQIIAAALCILALVATLVMAIAQKAIIRMYYHSPDIPRVFPTYQVLHALIMAGFMVLVFFLVKGNHTPGQTCAIVAVAVSVLALLQIAVFPLLQTLLMRSIVGRMGDMNIAAYSALQSGIGIFTGPPISAATILHLLAMGGYWRNGEDRAAEKSAPAGTESKDMINRM